MYLRARKEHGCMYERGFQMEIIELKRKQNYVWVSDERTGIKGRGNKLMDADKDKFQAN